MQQTVYNAAIYVRLSTKDKENDSIANQKNLIQDFVKNKKEINIVSVRIDDGYTGTNFDRPSFQLMLADIKEGRINCVIVKDLSRFGREYIGAGKYISRLFPFHGVRLIAINDNVDTITSNFSTEMHITIKNLLNDSYSGDISKKIRTALETKRKNGEFVGPFTSYGYKRSEEESERNKLLIDEYAASTVQNIFRWKLAGMSQDAISKKLNSLGVLSPLEYKRSQGFNYKSGFKSNARSLWTPVAVKRILTNELYIGTLIQGVRTTPNHKIKVVQVKNKKDWCVIPNHHESIVSEEDFALVQQLLLWDTRTSPNADAVYPLSGLTVCGDCLHPMIRKQTKSGDKKYAYYICSLNKRDRNSCSSHRIREEYLENTVLQIIQNHIRIVVEMKKCLDYIGNIPFQKLSLKKANANLLKIEEEISKYKKLKTNLYEDFTDGLLSKEDYRDINEQYEIRKKEAEESKIQIQKEIDMLYKKESSQQLWMQDFLQCRNINRVTRTVAVKLIKQIRVFDSKKLEVIFRHSQDYEKLLVHIQEISSRNNSTVEREVI